MIKSSPEVFTPTYVMVTETKILCNDNYYSMINQLVFMHCIPMLAQRV